MFLARENLEGVLYAVIAVYNILLGRPAGDGLSWLIEIELTRNRFINMYKSVKRVLLISRLHDTNTCPT